MRYSGVKFELYPKGAFMNACNAFNKVILSIVFTLGLISAAHAGDGGGRGAGGGPRGPGNGGGGNFCSAKLTRSKILAKALIKNSSARKLDQLDVETSAREIIKTKVHEEKNIFLKTLEEMEFNPAEGPLTVEYEDTKKIESADMVTDLTTHKVSVDTQKCDSHSEIEVAALMIHETSHAATGLRSSTKNEKLLWAVANGIIQSVDPVERAKAVEANLPTIAANFQPNHQIVANTQTTPYQFPRTLKELIVNGDPAYGKYLLPGNFPHSETTLGYDLLRSGREDLYVRFNENLKHLRMDENGIFRISEKFDDPVGAKLYGEAIKMAYGPHTGLKFAGGYRDATDFVYGTGFNDFPSKYQYSAFLVLNPNSETDIEIIKAENFKKIEEHVHAIRASVTRTLSEDARILESLNDIYGYNTTANAILERINKSKGALSAISASLVLMTPDEFRATIPQEAAARVRYLKACLDFSNNLLQTALKENNQQSVESLMQWNAFVKEEILK